MTLTLTANIDAATRFLTITGSDTVEPGYRFRIGDELLELQGFVMPYGTTQQDRNRWYVRRGQDGSTAASHTAGAEIKGAVDAFVAATSGTTPPSPFAAGGGGGQTADVQAALDGANAPDAGNVFATMDDISAPPGTMRVLDLGLVTVADLIDGAQTLYTPADGEFVVLLPGNPTDFEQIDNPATAVVMGQYPPLVWASDYDISWAQADTDPRYLSSVPFASTANTAPGVGSTPVIGTPAIRDTRPFLAAISVQSGGDPTIIAALPAWQAGHVYATDPLVRGDGHIWVGTDGTSDVSEPDWTANFGGSVVDNDITWFDQGAFPVAGTLHVYAMVATPVAP